MKDLEDLRSLVDIAVEKHSENMKLKGKCLTGPAALKAFYTLYGQVEQHKNDFDAMRCTHLRINLCFDYVLTSRTPCQLVASTS